MKRFFLSGGTFIWGGLYSRGREGGSHDMKILYFAFFCNDFNQTVRLQWKETASTTTGTMETLDRYAGGGGGGLRIHSRVFTFSSLEWKAYKGVFIQNVFQKRQDPSTMISHIKNISVGLWLHKRETHIQYPNMYKLYVSWNYIHRDCVSSRRPRDVSARLHRCAVGAQYVQSPKKTQN